MPDIAVTRPALTGSEWSEIVVSGTAAMGGVT
jgi:hypothetical protein